jgi:hypothetical protein
VSDLASRLHLTAKQRECLLLIQTIENKDIDELCRELFLDGLKGWHPYISMALEQDISIKIKDNRLQIYKQEYRRGKTDII